MSLPNYLAKIKSAGIYRFVWDKSQAPIQEAETMRLVVGYSEKGPFNTPVYIDNTADFKTIFGGISKRMEKKGIFFHRMALQALEAGPILALNLKKFGDEEISYINVTPQTKEYIVGATGVESIYNTARFWSLDEDKLPKLVTDSNKKYISLASTDSKDSSCSVFMRHCAPSGWDVTVQSWYAEHKDEEMPEYLENYLDRKLEDFFVDVFVFRGQFKENLAKTEELKKYFDVTSEIVDMNTEGTQIADFPAGYEAGPSTACVLKVNGEKYHIFNQTGSTGVKYINEAVQGITAVTITPVTGKDITVYNSDTAFDYQVYYSDGNGKRYISKGVAGEYYEVKFQEYTPEHKVILKVQAVDQGIVSAREGDPYQAGNRTVGSYDDADKKTYECYKVSDDEYHYYLLDSATSTDHEYTFVDDMKDAFGDDIDVLETLADDDNSKFVQRYQGILLPNFKDASGQYISLDIMFNLDNSTHKMMMKLDTDTLEGSDEPMKLLDATPWDGVAVDNDFILTPCYIPGYEYVTLTKDQTASEWQNIILSTLSADGYKGLILALTNNIDVEYHYIVDTFQTFISMSMKEQLALIAKKKDNALAILNFPFIKDYMERKDCYTNNVFDTAKIVKISGLPSTNNGASWCAFYTAMTLTDGTIKTVVPSAAVVSNAYMDKYQTRQPYSIVAGPNYGKIYATGLVGPDYNFSRSDLDVMEPFGVNCLVYVPRRGTQINSNQTAKQNPVSTLSKVSTRELVIYIQDKIAEMLYTYQWEFNTSTLRDNVKAKADVILDNVKANGGVYAYRNTCDESNNTADVINNEMLVLSTEIEPGMGAGKMVEELTLHRYGTLSSSAS